MVLEVACLIGAVFVGRELVVKTSAHNVFAELLTFVQFHDGASLIINMSLGPTVMLLLAALAEHPVARVFWCV